MKVISAEIIKEPDSEELALFVHCVDSNDDDRFFIGGVHENRWVYQEFATPNQHNTMWMGNESPF